MSSKASKLGTGTSFTQTQSVSARRQAINAATNAPTEGALPPVKLPVNAISLNPANPRSSLGDLSDLAASLRDHKQKQAITVMSRFSYLEANPTMAEKLEDGTKYIVIDGNSRLAAAREAGLTEIKVMIDEDLGDTAVEILESALVANIHRQDLDPLDEARALQQLLQVVGTQDALANRLHRSQGWVSQRLALLGLTPDLQAKLVAGEEPAELLRRVGNKAPEEQAAHLERLKEEKAAKKRVPSPTRSDHAVTEASAPMAPVEEPSASSSDHYAVMTGNVADTAAPPAPADVAPAQDSTRIVTPQDVADIAAVPAPADEAPAQNGMPVVPPQVKMPWADGAAAMEIAFAKLSQHGQRQVALARYIELIGDVEEFAQELHASTSPEYRAQLLHLLAAPPTVARGFITP
ncbi:ParB/RepB/Spo0J family partition protein [Streptomyces sp. MB09-01]|uniref:ParB/RepB/Spo0J family partition protein n=1 Tax=Streptomyces sp. MB09-01 TaxID=3028666 RepID=UPI0029A3EDCF|nr:ParB/RepB/Spo0J family partition protein [Streptomyces sp. MB09-01]MDX3539701.1 ParB/RepB/Spo0J family partition protein [Streptomyces sp. MB09-01]